MKEELLSITELAKLRRVTSETLRHYDRIGLLKPVYVNPETNYRYYSIRQYERLGTIKELRQLGMSIEEITEYFNGRNVKKSVEILTRHHHLLQEEIRQKMLLSKILSRKLHFLSELEEQPVSDVVFESCFPKRYMITFGEPAGGPREHAYAFTKLEWYLDETAPILASDRVGVYADERLLERSDEYIPSVPMLFVEDSDIQSEYKHEIPAGQYLCMYYQNGGLEEYSPSFELIKDYLRVHNYAVNGKIFQFYKIDVTLTSDPRETLMEIQVPVRRADEPSGAS
ncbi:MAG: MerR family transcriptional regulator [Oscillospiraceae bacterium]|nr:MerR family transcriptional regulator [Oscillospiraceae bacterium]